MSDPIDLNAEREKRYGPDSENTYIDDKGVRWGRFSCSYNDGDTEMCFDIWAVDPEDAQRRMALLKATAKVDGQLYTSIDA